MLGNKDEMSLKEILPLLALLAIVLVLPLLSLRFFEHNWSELHWNAPTEIAMAEWTAAFLNIFLFLLFIEHARSSGRYVFAPMACGFLAMGTIGFVLALAPPGSELATWLRFFSIMLGSVCFSFSIPARKWRQFELAGMLAKMTLPAFLLAILAAWVPFSIKQLLPQMLGVNGKLTLFCSIMLMVPCAFFFFTSLFWLHEYLARKSRIAFLISVIVMVFAQMTLFMRSAETWGVLWWIWHVVWVVDLLLACVYLLALSVIHSIVWKLMLSLGLAFSLTVMLASGIIQSNSEKTALKTFMQRLHERHKKLLMERDSSFKFADYMLRTMSNDAKDISERGNMLEQLKCRLDQREKEWEGMAECFGFVTDETTVSLPVKKKLCGEKLKSLLKTLDTTSLRKGHVKWGTIRYLPKLKRFLSVASTPFRMKGLYGKFFVVVDVSSIMEPLLPNRKNSISPEPCVVYDLDTAKILFALLPGARRVIPAVDMSEQSRNIATKLVAATFGMTDRGKTIVVSTPKKKFFISANQETPPGWGVIKFADFDQFPAVKSESRYFFIAVSMPALLCGFVVLLLLLHKQLSQPLSELIRATRRLESGDFNVNIKTKDSTEIGAIAQAFNNMATKLKQLYLDLAETVEMRTEALENAKKANTAKTSFFQNVSHELRTPLHGILSFARLGSRLDFAANAEKTRKYFNNIHASGERLMNMLNSILDLAKLESGHMNFKFQYANLHAPLLRVAGEMKGAFDERGVSLVIPDRTQDMEAMFDPEMMARVFSNLIGNALKMSPENSKVTVEIKRLDDRIEVAIRDKGPGVPVEELNNIFNKFVQEEAGRHRGGTGLGLPICREIILAHGGTISAANRDGNGAVFTFCIPVKTQSQKRKGSDNDERKTQQS